MRNIFTHADRTEKKYIVQDAINAARMILNERKPRLGMCTNTLKRLSFDTPITLERLNEIQRDLLEDSYYYNVEM